MAITPAEIAETRGMVEEQNLDIRTITMGVSLMGCGDENLDRMCTKIYDHVTHTAEHLVETAENLEREYGIPIVNKRVSVTPVAQIAACCKDEDLTPIAHALDRAAETLGIDYLGGFSALVQKGIGDADRRVIQSIPQALATTSRVCSSVNVASTKAGINMDAVRLMGQAIKKTAELTKERDAEKPPMKSTPQVFAALSIALANGTKSSVSHALATSAMGVTEMRLLTMGMPSSRSIWQPVATRCSACRQILS